MKRLVGCAVALSLLSACQPPGAQPDEAAVAAAEARIPPPHEARDPLDDDGGKRFIVAVVGYNYTARDIDSFTVAGSGGSVRSGQTGGASVGGSFPKDIPWDLLQFKVRWAAGGCMVKVTNSYGESREVIRYSYKEEIVRLQQPLPANPLYLEVHFYPDDRIELAVTELYSDARLPEAEVKEDLSPYPPCEEKKP